MSRLTRVLSCVALSLTLTAPAFVRAADDDAMPGPAAGVKKPAAKPAKKPAKADDAPAADPAAAPDPAAPDKPAAVKPADATAPTDSAAPATEPSADATTAPTTQEVEIPQNLSLLEDVDNFWHFGKLNRYDMAAAYGKKVLSRTEKPLEILQGFETVTTKRNDVMDRWLLRWQSLEGAKGSNEAQMRVVALDVIKLLDKGRYERRNDRKVIEEQITRLGVNQRAYADAVERLRQSGDVAVALMIQDLQDAKKSELHEPIRQAIISLGRVGLGPLLASLDMRQNDSALITVVSALSQIGYDASVPYLARLKDDSTASSAVRSATNNALRNMGADLRGKSVADLFYALSEKFYYGNAPITFDPKSETATLWSWEGDGLKAQQVPSVIFNDLMAMRTARYALQLGSGRSDALSLWLAANNKREVDLGEGTDPTASKLSASFYNVDAGPKYLAAVLARTLADHNAAVAMKVTKSLAQITGPSSLVDGGNPLVDAMHYPDRLVRFEAAFALANALPSKPFNGSEMVVPLLAEAVSQTGMANLLVVVPSVGARAKLAGDLKAYGIAGGATAQQAIADSASLPAVDVILVSEDVGAGEIDRLFQLAGQSPRLARAARLVMTRSRASQWSQRALVDPLLSTTQAAGGDGLVKDIEAARKRVGGLPLDDKVATGYALQASTLLEKLAVNRNPVLDLSVAEPTLTGALNDKRPEVAKAVGVVLAALDSQNAQSALFSRASDEKLAEDVRISLFKSLAVSSKAYGNRLESGQVTALQSIVDGSGTPELRTAAAEARGALNLQADEAKKLITGQKS